MVDQRTVDALLDKHSRHLKALQVMHLESDSDLPFDDWVETIAIRHLAWTESLTETSNG